MPSRRAGAVSIPVVFFIAFLLAGLLSQLHVSTTQQAQLTSITASLMEHLHRAEAAQERVVARLRPRPWEARFYAQGGVDTGPWSYQEAGTYRDSSFEQWVEDVSVQGSPPVPGLVDIFTRVTYEGRVRAFLARIALRRRRVFRQATLEDF